MNIFLDAGGVILDEETHEQVRAEVITETIRLFKPSFGLGDYWDLVREAVYRFVPGVYDYVIFRIFPDSEIFQKIKSDSSLLWNRRRPGLRLSSGLDTVLESLAKNHRIGILGQYGAELTDFLQEHDLLRYFTYRDTQERFEITKPDPRYFELVLAGAGVDPSDSVMVGDRIDKDVIPARQIGMKTIRIRTGIHRDQKPRTPDEVPDIEVEFLTGILDHL